MVEYFVYPSYRELPKKAKVTLQQPTKAQRGIEVKLYSFFNLNSR
jgi:hypothetical protein